MLIRGVGEDNQQPPVAEDQIPVVGLPEGGLGSVSPVGSEPPRDPRISCPESVMKSLYTIAAVVLLGALAPPSLAQKAFEFGYETSPREVRVPESATGELTMQACATCKVLRLRATAATRYEIGGKPVSLAEMTQYLRGHQDASLVVMQRAGALELSRLVVHVLTPTQSPAK